MLYFLAEFINREFSPPGFDVFRFITWRSALAAITAMIISFWIGPKIIRRLKERKVADEIREDGPKQHLVKAGTPTMGGVIVLLSVLIPVLLWGDLRNTYVLLILLSTIWMGVVGFMNDYLKVFKTQTGLACKVQINESDRTGARVACRFIFYLSLKI
jgi:phospho-N-acetylmuramoyl-pentapeptide-transferase